MTYDSRDLEGSISACMRKYMLRRLFLRGKECESVYRIEEKTVTVCTSSERESVYVSVSV